MTVNVFPEYALQHFTVCGLLQNACKFSTTRSGINSDDLKYLHTAHAVSIICRSSCQCLRKVFAPLFLGRCVKILKRKYMLLTYTYWVGRSF